MYAGTNKRTPSWTLRPISTMNCGDQPDGAILAIVENVSLVDREAIRLLALAEKNGAELGNCPAYIREWVTREKADDESGLI